MSNIILLSGSSAGDALGGIGRAYKTVFNEMGYEFVDIQFGQGEAAIAKLNAALTKPVEFAFSFMGAGSDLSLTNPQGEVSNLWEKLGIPFLTIYGDTPAYFFDRHVARGANFAGLYGFPEHLHLRNRLPQINGYIGGAAPMLLDMLSPEEVDFKAKAGGKLLFLKNGNDPEALRASWAAALPARPLAALQEIASALTGDLTGNAANQIDDVVVRYFAEHDYNVTRLLKLRLFFIAQLDDYLRRVKANMMVHALLDFPVEIRGLGWEHIDATGRAARLIAQCDFEESKQLINSALGLLDMSPNTGLAPHDRVLRSFGRYTFCLTNEQEYFAREVPLHEQMSFRFEPQALQALQAKVADILTRPTHYVELGREISQKYRQSHPAAAAAAGLIEVAGLVRLNQLPSRPAGLPPYFVWPPAALK